MLFFCGLDGIMFGRENIKSLTIHIRMNIYLCIIYCVAYSQVNLRHFIKSSHLPIPYWSPNTNRSISTHTLLPGSSQAAPNHNTDATAFLNSDQFDIRFWRAVWPSAETNHVRRSGNASAAMAPIVRIQRRMTLPSGEVHMDGEVGSWRTVWRRRESSGKGVLPEGRGKMTPTP